MKTFNEFIQERAGSLTNLETLKEEYATYCARQKMVGIMTVAVLHEDLPAEWHFNEEGERFVLKHFASELTREKFAITDPEDRIPRDKLFDIPIKFRASENGLITRKGELIPV